MLHLLPIETANSIFKPNKNKAASVYHVKIHSSKASHEKRPQRSHICLSISVWSLLQAIHPSLWALLWIWLRLRLTRQSLHADFGPNEALIIIHVPAVIRPAADGGPGLADSELSSVFASSLPAEQFSSKPTRSLPAPLSCGKHVTVWNPLDRCATEEDPMQGVELQQKWLSLKQEKVVKSSTK